MKTIRMEKITSPVSYVWGAICTAIGAFSLNEWAVLIGIIVSIATYFTNLYYKNKKDKRDAELCELAKLKYIEIAANEQKPKK